MSIHRYFLWVMVMVLATHNVTAQVIDTFAYGTTDEAIAAWRAVGDAPPVSPAASGGLTFPIPFGDDRDRVYWDRDGQWDLSASTGFELDIACPEPEAMRSLSLYFRSGSGWYIWSQPLSAAGRQKLILPKTQFSVEGSPAGWDAIDTIRISPWKGQARDTELTLHRLAGRRDSLFIAVGSDAAVSQRTADRLSRWLKASGIPHSMTTDDRLESVAAEASMIILPYNPRLPESGLNALKTFTERGGKLVVLFSSDEQLAALMDIQLGSITNTRDIGKWRGMTFTSSAPTGLPARVNQQSWMIGPARPASEKSTAMAFWNNAAGEISEEPAVIASPHGYWFTHVLLDDDMIAKQRTLGGLLASLDASLWESIADHALLNAGRIDGWRNADEAIEALNLLAADHPNGETIRAFTRRIGIQARQLRDLHKLGQFRDAALKGYELTDLLIKTYGLAQTAAPGEFRGVWDHDGTGWYPGDWDRTAKLMAESGINAIFINATWAGLAHYPSKILPESYTKRFYGDQLAQCIAAARKYDIEVHAWIVCWYLENAPVEFTQPLRNGDRLQHTSGGAERLWMNPAHPENRQHHLDIVREILTNYEVDGIHLDYIRYPDANGCFSPYTRRQFEEASGFAIQNWPQDVLKGGQHYNEFITWRAGVISSFVKETRAVANEVKPAARLSAAVWGGYPQVITSIGQDWASWMKDGLLDFVCPMNYANELYRFTALVDRQLVLPGVRGKLFPGLGVTANESQLRGDQVVEQILALRKREVGGFVLFDLSTTLVDDTLPTLRMGVSKP